MYVCNTVKMQMKKIKIKNLLCWSFHMPSQNFLYLYCFYHLGLFYWSGSQISWVSNWEWATGVSFYNPLKFPEAESKHLWLLCHILFYSRFCISAPTPVILFLTQSAERFSSCHVRNFRERAATSKNCLKNEQECILSGLKTRGEAESFYIW